MEACEDCVKLTREGLCPGLPSHVALLGTLLEIPSPLSSRRYNIHAMCIIIDGGEIMSSFLRDSSFLFSNSQQ